MRDATDDHILQNILLDAAAEEYAAELSSDEAVPTSLHFQRQMRQMLANPNTWARKRRQPLWQRYIQKAAVFLLVCSLSLGIIMFASPTARAAIMEWVMERYEMYVVYRFSGEHNLEEMPRYDIIELPPGYNSAGEVQELINCVIITYKNEEGDAIYFEYDRTEAGSERVINAENAEIYEVDVCGHSGHLYLSTDPKESNAIVWYDMQKHMQFMIDGFCDKNELLKMASSISVCNMTKK